MTWHDRFARMAIEHPEKAAIVAGVAVYIALGVWHAVEDVRSRRFYRRLRRTLGLEGRTVVVDGELYDDTRITDEGEWQDFLVRIRGPDG